MARKGSPVDLRQVSALGVEIAAPMVVLTLLGWWLDRRWDTLPLFTLIGAGVAMVGVGYKLYMLWKRLFGPEGTDRGRR